MNVSFEKNDAVNGVFTVDIARDDFANDVKKEVKEMGARRPIKGFRPGHAPMSLLMKYYGGYATNDVVDRKVGNALVEYIRENKLRVFGEPLLAEDTHVDLMDASQDAFTFKFDAGLIPEINLTVDKNITIPYYKIEVTDEMVNDAIEHDRKRLGKTIDGEVAEKESMLRGSLTQLDADGNVLEGGINVERTVISPRFLEDAEEADKFVGAKVGDKVTYNPYKSTNGNVAELSSLLNVDRDVAAIVKSDFVFTVENIKVNQPADLDQEFFDNVAGKDKVHNEQELRDEMHKKLEELQVPQSNHRFTVDAENVLMQTVGDIELPEAFLTRYVKQNRASDDKPEPTEQEMKESFNQLRWQLVRDHMIEAFGIEVTKEDINNVAMALAQQQMSQYGIFNAPQQTLENYAQRILEDERAHNMCATSAADQKMFAKVKDGVTLDEKTVTVEEFNKLYEADEQAE